MIKKTLFFFTILAFSLSQAQNNTLHFEVQYLPNKEYKKTIDTSSKITTTFSGNNTIISKMKAENMDNPQTTAINDKYEFLMTTQNLKNDIFDFSLKVKNPNMIALNDAVFTGQCKIGEAPVLTNLTAANLTEDTKKQIINTFQAMLEKTIPNKELKPGRAF